MEIKKISAEQIYKNSMERIANRPTEASRFGRGGMDPAQLKAEYDKLAKLAIEKINEVINAIHSDASEESITNIILTPIQTGDQDGEYKTLYEVMVDILGGEFASYLKLNGLFEDDLQAELERLQRELELLQSLVGDGSKTEFATDAEVIKMLEKVYDKHSDDMPEDDSPITENDFATDEEVEDMLNEIFGDN